LKYVNAAIATRTMVMIQSDESLIPVFFAMCQSCPESGRYARKMLMFVAGKAEKP
jgi:hypothetical protein